MCGVSAVVRLCNSSPEGCRASDTLRRRSLPSSPPLSGSATPQHADPVADKQPFPQLLPVHSHKLNDRLNASTSCMRHRGPDHQHAWISDDRCVGLAHARLATRDLSSAGHQPLHDKGSGLHVVVNGELYYDPAVRQDLIDQGSHQFTSVSDSEMAIALYKRMGPSFVSALRGEFSLVLYDEHRQTLMAARDRYGVKPLYWTRSGNGELLFASQIKGIVALDQRPEWDLESMACNGSHWTARTLFKGIKKLAPGHLLVCRLSADTSQSASVQITPYWRPTYPEMNVRDDRSIDELVQGLRVRLVEAVRLRLESSDVAVGCLLSGGVDSSAVAGIAHHIRSQSSTSRANAIEGDLTCFTIAFEGEEDELDESAIAKRTTEYLDVPLEKLVMSESDFAENFEETVVRGETLLYDLQNVAKKTLSKRISALGFRVVLNGDGSDELFGGYNFFKADRLLQSDCSRSTESSMTEQERKALFDKEVASSWFGHSLAEHSEQNQTEAKRSLGIGPGIIAYASQSFQPWEKPELFSHLPHDSLEALLSELDPDVRQALTTIHPLHRSMSLWNAALLPNVVIAAISDGAEMAHSVESRPPFLDHVVAEYANRLPVDVKVRFAGGRAVEKWIFREAVRPFVTQEVYAGAKQAFAAPWRWQRDGPLRRKMDELICRSNIDRLGFADWHVCNTLVERAFGQQDQQSFRQVIWLAQIVCLGKHFNVPPAHHAEEQQRIA